MEAQNDPADDRARLQPLRGWRVLIGYCGYPLILMASVLTAQQALAADVSPLYASGLPVLAVILLVAVLERILPFRQSWYAPPKVLLIDVVHSAVGAGVVLPAMKVTVFAAIATLSAHLATFMGRGLWPTEAPTLVQFALVVLVADLGAYSVHRFMHVSRIGWLLHAVHHSVDRLDVLAAGRAHPFNAAFTLSFENGLLILLGVPPELLILFSVYKGSNGLLQHSNVDFRTGPLKYIWATTEVHRWHHSSELVESNANFGNTTMIWDHIFRSFAVPHDRVAPGTIGIDNATIPENYWVHLGVPFILRRFERRPDEGA